MKGTIKSKSDVERLFQTGRRSSSSLMVIISDENPSNQLGYSRSAFVAGKKLGSAPFRNRCKRVMRAAAQSLGNDWNGHDVVFMARRRVAYAPCEKVVSNMRRQLEELGVLA